MYLRRKTRGYTQERLEKSSKLLEEKTKALGKSYSLVYKDEIAKRKEKEAKEIKKKKDIKKEKQNKEIARIMNGECAISDSIKDDILQLKRIKFSNSNIERLAILIPHVENNRCLTNIFDVIFLDGTKTKPYNEKFECYKNSIDKIKNANVSNKKMKALINKYIELKTREIKFKTTNCFMKYSEKSKYVLSFQEEAEKVLEKILKLYPTACKNEVEKVEKAKAKERELRKKLREKVRVKEPKFKGGGAIVIKHITDNAVEYESEMKYEVTIYFKSATAFNKFEKIVGIAYRSSTSRFGAKYVVDAILNDSQMYMTEEIFGQGHISNKLYFSHHNHYEDYYYDAVIDVPSMRVEMSQYHELKTARYGSSANGDDLVGFIGDVSTWRWFK
jgi:hypothetical protein